MTKNFSQILWLKPAGLSPSGELVGGFNSQLSTLSSQLSSCPPIFTDFKDLFKWKERKWKSFSARKVQEAEYCLHSYTPPLEPWTLNFRSSEHRAKFTSAMSRFPRFTRLPVAFRDENHGLKGHNLEPAAASSPPRGSWWGFWQNWRLRMIGAASVNKFAWLTEIPSLHSPTRSLSWQSSPKAIENELRYFNQVLAKNVSLWTLK